MKFKSKKKQNKYRSNWNGILLGGTKQINRWVWNKLRFTKGWKWISSKCTTVLNSTPIWNVLQGTFQNNQFILENISRNLPVRITFKVRIIESKKTNWSSLNFGLQFHNPIHIKFSFHLFIYQTEWISFRIQLVSFLYLKWYLFQWIWNDFENWNVNVPLRRTFCILSSSDERRDPSTE